MSESYSFILNATPCFSLTYTSFFGPYSLYVPISSVLSPTLFSDLSINKEPLMPDSKSLTFVLSNKSFLTDIYWAFDSPASLYAFPATEFASTFPNGLYTRIPSK